MRNRLSIFSSRILGSALVWTVLAAALIEAWAGRALPPRFTNHEVDQLLDLRENVAKTLEPMRAAGEIGAALEAEIVVSADEPTRAWLQPLADELRFFFISGDVTVQAAGAAPSIMATPTSKPKCVRCWQHRADVGTHDEHPELCGRCIDNIDGPGEDRRWF